MDTTDKITELIKGAETQGAANPYFVIVAKGLNLVDRLHTVKARYYTPDYEGSFDTAVEAAESNEAPIEDVEFFEVCAHCSAIEDVANEDADEWAYRAGLWPCATHRLIAAAVFVDIAP